MQLIIRYGFIQETWTKNRDYTESPIKNYLVMFTEKERMVDGQTCAARHKYNHFTILNNTRLWSFKFDHIIPIENQNQPLRLDDESNNVNKGLEDYDFLVKKHKL